MGKRFSAPVQNGPGTHPASYSRVPDLFPRGQSGLGVVKERIELHLYSLSGSSLPVLGRTIYAKSNRHHLVHNYRNLKIQHIEEEVLHSVKLERNEAHLMKGNVDG